MAQKFCIQCNKVEAKLATAKYKFNENSDTEGEIIELEQDDKNIKNLEQETNYSDSDEDQEKSYLDDSFENYIENNDADKIQDQNKSKPKSQSIPENSSNCSDCCRNWTASFFFCGPSPSTEL